jgi:hypothetical protein
MGLAAAAAESRLAGLSALRDLLAEQIEVCDSPRDLAPLSRQLTDVLAQIEAVEKAAPEKKGSPLDELQNRRIARQPGTARRAGS